VAVLKILLNAETLEVDANFCAQEGNAGGAFRHGDLYLPTEGLIDVEAEKARLKKNWRKSMRRL